MALKPKDVWVPVPLQLIGQFLPYVYFQINNFIYFFIVPLWPSKKKKKKKVTLYNKVVLINVS